jgi:hypothetical protein
MRRNTYQVVLYIFILVLFYQTAFGADRQYLMRGIITDIQKDSFAVQSEKGMFEFGRDEKDTQLPKNAKVGDDVSIWYTVDMEKIAIRKKSKTPTQEPGQLDPNQQRIILDDRVFYSAKNAKEIIRNNNHQS